MPTFGTLLRNRTLKCLSYSTIPNSTIRLNFREAIKKNNIKESELRSSYSSTS